MSSDDGGVLFLFDWAGGKDLVQYYCVEQRSQRLFSVW